MKHLDQHWLFKEYKDIGFLKGKLCRIHSYPRETSRRRTYRITLDICPLRVVARYAEA